MKTKRTQRGVVLMTVLILAGLAAILAGGVYFASTSELRSAQKSRRNEQALFAAESGVQWMIRAFNSAPTSNMTSYINAGIYSINLYCGGWNARAVVEDDEENDGNPNVDTNDTLYIVSTGIYQSVQRVLKVKVYRPISIPPIVGADGAIGFYGEGATLAVAQPHIRVYGEDFAVPANFYCSGAGCNGTVTTNPSVPGVYKDATNSVAITGSNYVSGSVKVATGGGTYTEQDFYSLVARLVSSPDIIIPGGTLAGNNTFGTRAEPKVTLIQGDMRLTGTADGAGILIIQGGVDVDLTGTLHFEGLVIVMGDGISDNANEFDDKGAAKIFGAMVVIGDEVDVSIKGAPAVSYSSAALANIQNIMPKNGIETLTWRELKRGY
jgi:hypothetical protein